MQVHYWSQLPAHAFRYQWMQSSAWVTQVPFSYCGGSYSFQVGSNVNNYNDLSLYDRNNDRNYINSSNYIELWLSDL